MALPIKRLDKRIVQLWSEVSDPESWSRAFENWGGLLTPFGPRYPQPGFIGKGYFKSTCRILVMGINPGSGKGYEDRDEVLFDAILQLADAPNAKHFKSLMSIYSVQAPHWGIFSRRGILRRLALTFENIAYLNVLQVNAEVNCTDKRLDPVYRYAISKFTSSQLKLLKPDIVLILGKHGEKMLDEYWSVNDRPDGLEIMSIWHPSSPWVGRNPARFEAQMKGARKFLMRAIRQVVTHSS